MSTPRRTATSSALLVLSLAVCLAVVAPVATAQTAEPGFLLVQSARNGSLVPVRGSDDEFTLTLGGVGPWALWFTDRPNRTSGHLPHAAALDLLGFDDKTPAGPPNAVLSVPDAARNHNMVALTLRAPRYDARAKTLRYRATRLPAVAKTPLASYGREVDRSVPRHFGNAALFVDSGSLPGCNIRIHFRTKFDGQVVYDFVQDFIPSPGGSSPGSWRGIPSKGQTVDPNTGDIHLELETLGTPASYWCRGGVALHANPGNQPIFVYFNNPISKDSSWGCGTMPAEWSCAFSGNKSGQPLSVDVDITSP